MLGLETRLALESGHLLSEQLLLLLHSWHHLLHRVEGGLHHLLHHRVLLLVKHELLSLKLLLLLVLVEQLLVVVLDLAALLLRDMDAGVLLQDLSQLFNLHVLVEERLLLLKLLLHLLLGELTLAVDGHSHAVGLHLLEVLLLHLRKISNLLIRNRLCLLDELSDLGLLGFHLHILEIDLLDRLLLSNYAWHSLGTDLHGLHLSLEVLLPLDLVRLRDHLSGDVCGCRHVLNGLHGNWLGFFLLSLRQWTGDIVCLLLLHDFLTFSALGIGFLALGLFFVVLEAPLDVGLELTADSDWKLVKDELTGAFTLPRPLLYDLNDSILLLRVK